MIDSESFGMRHRSAVRCIASAEAAAAFVVSQDGVVTFMWKQDGRLLLKRNVNTANPEHGRGVAGPQRATRAAVLVAVRGTDAPAGFDCAPK